MAAPRKINIIRDCGLVIELVNKSTFTGIDPTDSSLPWEYHIQTDLKFTDYKTTPHNGNDDDPRLNGWLSPIAHVTLSVEQLELAGIPKQAKTFAFMYPPQELAAIFQRNDPHLIVPETSDDPELGDNIKSALIMGGFVYFDSELNCIFVNALSVHQSINKIRFSGPFEACETTCVELIKEKKKGSLSNRIQPLNLDIFREAGFVSFAWVRPREKFNFQPVFPKYENKHGALLFFRENWTAAAYAVDDTSEFVDPTGAVEILSNVFGYNSASTFSQIQNICSIYEVQVWKEEHEHLLNLDDIDIVIDKLVTTLDDKKTLFHRACHAYLGVDFTKVLLESEEVHNLSYRDSFGWTPLHYACRFSPKDSSLIELLVQACPAAVLVRDYYGRYPLHIACDSDTSADVITSLLAADTSPEKATTTSGTRRFGLLPIHFVCYKGYASESVLEALLNDKIECHTSVVKTVRGQMPLHLAILSNASPSIIKLLLDADSKLKTSRPTLVSDIYHAFDRKLPLHWACWNNSSSEIIELLLEKDEFNTTIYESPDAQEPSHEDLPSFTSLGKSYFSFKTACHQNSQGEYDDDDEGEYDDDEASKLSSIDESFHTNDSSFVVNQNIPIHFDEEGGESCNISFKSTHHPCDGVALHLALKHGCKDVIGLLLQKEIEGNMEGKDLSINIRDRKGRTPLHVACENHADPQVNELLLTLDLTKETTQACDKDGFRPIHYACMNKMTCVGTIDFIQRAEEQYNETKKMTITDESIKIQKNPLYLAVKAGATDSVVERLLQAEKVILQDFDEHAMAELADMISGSKTIQRKILEILSDRLYFIFIMIDFYAHIGALLSFFLASNNLRPNLRDATDDNPSTLTFPIILLICTCVFILREIVDIRSVGVDYIHDHWSWNEILCIIFLLISVNHMIQKNHNEEIELRSTILIITGFSLVLQLILFLRTTFLPFGELLLLLLSYV